MLTFLKADMANPILNSGRQGAENAVQDRQIPQLHRAGRRPGSHGHCQTVDRPPPEGLPHQRQPQAGVHIFFLEIIPK